MEVGFVFSNSIVLHAAGVSEIPEVSCVMHKRLQMIGNKTITRARSGVETSGDKIRCDFGEERKGSNLELVEKKHYNRAAAPFSSCQAFASLQSRRNRGL